MMVLLLFIIGFMGLFFYNKIGSIIPTVFTHYRNYKAKFSIGIASVMIGQFYLDTVINTPKVQADERTKTEVEAVNKQEDKQLAMSLYRQKLQLRRSTNNRNKDY